MGHPSPIGRGPLEKSPRSLIDDLLADQRELTAVEEFSRAHDANEFRGRHYAKLLPASAPALGQQYAFEVDLDKCSGCKACVTACHSLNGLNEDETWRSVGALVSADVRHPFKQTITTACHHCVDPGCLNGCPVLAYDKDPHTGIVKHLDDQCIGCQYCVMKCPYEVPQYLPRLGIVRKCDMCSSRLAVGEAPACVQACPNEAIKITLADQARVRGRYRVLKDECRMTKPFSSGLSIRHSSFIVSNPFLPDSPNPAITLPTTRYVTQRTLPSELEAEDAHELRPAQAHPPLTLLLVFSQLAVGLALMGALSGGRSRANAAVALIVTVIAVAAGSLHLGQPLKAWRSFLGWRKSWFSRELIAFGVFLGALCAHVAILHPLSSILAAIAGLIAVACSAMIYVDTRRPFWNAAMTFGKFLGTTLLLGALASAPMNVIPPALPRFALIVFGLGVFVKLTAENRIFGFLINEQDPHLNALNKSALLLAGRFGFQSRARIGCLAAGIIVLLAAQFSGLPGAAHFALFSSALALCLTGELIERHLFFVAEVGPKMPGGATV